MLDPFSCASRPLLRSPRNYLVGALLLGSLLALAALGACGSSDPAIPDQYEFGGDRPVLVDVPEDYDPGVKTPLLIVLHGFGTNGFTQLRYTALDKLVNEVGVIIAAPEGTVNSEGNQFWNATDACCDGFNSGVDDVAYITSLIDDISAVWNIDPKRVFLFGHSNGGFMSYRMACDRSDRIAAIVSLAGSTWKDESDCSPTSNVSVLQIHGTGDTTVPYEGTADYPSAPRTSEIWAGYNGCATTPTRATERYDLDVTKSGDDTDVDAYADCPTGIDVGLWTMVDVGHIPAVTDDFRAKVWEFLAAHPKQQ